MADGGMARARLRDARRWAPGPAGGADEEADARRRHLLAGDEWFEGDVSGPVRAVRTPGGGVTLRFAMDVEGAAAHVVAELRPWQVRGAAGLLGDPAFARGEARVRVRGHAATGAAGAFVSAVDVERAPGRGDGMG